MPLGGRRPTPPPSAVKQTLTVMDSLNAWTTDEDHEKDEPLIKKLPLGYTPFAQADRMLAVTGWRAWFDTESDNFNVVVGIVIITNAIVIGLETDMGRGRFTIAEHLFNTIFVLEMLTRIGHIGPSYFTTPSYLFDFSLVVTGTLDLWILPAITADEGPQKDSDTYSFSVMRLLRILRLLRVLRVIRLFRMFGQLLLMVRAFGKSIQVVLLLSILVFIMIYALGIVCTQLIGHKASDWGDNADEVTQWFGTIPASMATLFWVMFGSGWDPLLRLLTVVYPTGMVLLFLSAYMVITIALLALIVGLISESLIIAQGDFKQRTMDKYAIAKKGLAAELGGELKELLEDEMDEMGAVDALQLKQAVKGDSTLVSKLIAAGVQTSQEVLLLLVDSMSKSGTENVNIDYFVEKLINLSGQSSASAVVDLKYDLLKNRMKAEKLGIEVESVKNDLGATSQQMTALTQKMEEILKRIK